MHRSEMFQRDLEIPELLGLLRARPNRGVLLLSYDSTQGCLTVVEGILTTFESRISHQELSMGDSLPSVSAQSVATSHEISVVISDAKGVIISNISESEIIGGKQEHDVKLSELRDENDRLRLKCERLQKILVSIAKDRMGRAEVTSELDRIS